MADTPNVQNHTQLRQKKRSNSATKVRDFHSNLLSYSCNHPCTQTCTRQTHTHLHAHSKHAHINTHSHTHIRKGSMQRVDTQTGRQTDRQTDRHTLTCRQPVSASSWTGMGGSGQTNQPTLRQTHQHTTHSRTNTQVGGKHRRNADTVLD